MIVSDFYCYVFISTPKAGTHTLYHVLEKQYSGVRMKGSYHQNVLPKGLENYFVFTSVRHPFSRCVAIWHSLIRHHVYRKIYLPKVGGESFKEFVWWLVSHKFDEQPTGKGAVLIPPQSDWLAPVGRLDAVLKLERLEADFKKLPFVTNHAEPLPKLLARDHEAWNKIADAQIKKLLSKYYEKDLELFGYDPNFVE